jgi:succinate dehydrogenase hydrophobic anchor subunit
MKGEKCEMKVITKMRKQQKKQQHYQSKRKICSETTALVFCFMFRYVLEILYNLENKHYQQLNKLFTQTKNESREKER